MPANEAFPNQQNKSPGILILEQITSLVFLLLLAAIVCILFLSYIPGMGHPVGMESGSINHACTSWCIYNPDKYIGNFE